MLVDEFHALPAADYEAFLAERGKYGASLVLATQSLGTLDAIGADRGFKDKVFANVDHLYAFNCSAEDVRALAPEPGGRSNWRIWWNSGTTSAMRALATTERPTCV